MELLDRCGARQCGAVCQLESEGVGDKWGSKQVGRHMLCIPASRYAEIGCRNEMRSQSRVRVDGVVTELKNSVAYMQLK